MGTETWETVRARLDDVIMEADVAIENDIERAADEGWREAERRALAVLLQAHVESPEWWNGVEESEGPKFTPTADQIWFARQILEDVMAHIWDVTYEPDKKYLVQDCEAIDFYDVSDLLASFKEGAL